VSNINAKHPDSTFHAEYPHNHSELTASGHEFFVNDTPGHESLRRFHTKGTGEEINETGAITRVAVDVAHHYYADSLCETVDGHHDLKVAGALNVNVDGSVSDVTAGNRYLSSGGDQIGGVGGDRYIHVGGSDSTSVDGDLVYDVEGSRHASVLGDSVDQVQGGITQMASGDYFIAVGGGIEIQADSDGRIKVANMTIEADSITLKAGGSSIVMNDGGITIKGARVDIN